MAMRRFVGELFIVNKEVTVALAGWADDEAWGGWIWVSEGRVITMSHSIPTRYL